ncbi:MAG: carboxylating nicotinate-nucleotide diphosphorylase [Planctomycetes bacterium]|nr:carboxylating nicotinate-nucleotide diphosphorylase [Planctomycetota bacterium]
MPASTFASLVTQALEEDLGRGDATARAVVEPDTRARAVVLAKGEGIVAGMPVARAVLRQVDRRVRVRRAAADGARVTPGDRVLELAGPARSILEAERVCLNFLQRLSGIATATDRLVGLVRGTSARVYDTRKTVPGYRALDKYAVRMGGGVNHRDGLYDQILLKENHFAAAAAQGLDFAATVRRARQFAGRRLRVEVETENLAQFHVALAEGADIIMLDEFSLADMRKAVAAARKRRPRPELEASGGITQHNIRAVAETGVDRISVGALTHSVRAFDLALYVESAR